MSVRPRHRLCKILVVLIPLSHRDFCATVGLGSEVTGMEDQDVTFVSEDGFRLRRR